MKDILNYENLYKIDCFANIYSLPRKGTIKTVKKIYQRKNKFGYMQVTLMKDNKMKTHLVHRLMAKTFLDNPEKLPQVNHIDGNKSNNNLDNLEWCSASKNTKHAYDRNLNGFRDNALKNLNIINKETMYNYIKIQNEKEVKYFDNTQEVSNYLQTHKDNITRAFRKKQKCKGYIIICKRIANGES